MRVMESEKAAKRREWRRDERGQAIILLVGLVTVIFVIAAIVIDFGLWLSERRSVQTVADLAALAGSQDLLIDDDAAIANAIGWAAKNGFSNDDDGVNVTVELLCQNTLISPPAGICTNTNPPGDGPSICQPGSGCDSLRVKISKPASRLFTSIFNIGGIDVASGAGAVAGLTLDVVALDAVVLLDASYSMACRDGACPMEEARDAANGFVDVLVGGIGDLSQVGYVPYNYCYNPPRRLRNCIPEANVIGLTTDGGALHDAINATIPRSSTNVCFPLLRALEMLSGPRAQTGSGVRRSVLLLTDGDNNYSSSYYESTINYPPSECRPSSYNRWLDPGIFQPCQPVWANGQEQELDVLTWQIANVLKGQGIEIYVVALDVCGSDDGRTASDAGYCNGIGDGAHDNIADQRLLKCIASSPDHYFRVSSAQELTGSFRTVAGGIARRGLLQ